MDNILRIIVALLCGSLIGYERESQDKSAGLRTCILTIFSMTMAMIFNNCLLEKIGIAFDFARIPSYCIASIGFLGSGVIILNKKQVEGITTASVLLCLVIAGLLCGLGEYILTITSTLIMYGVLKLKHFKIKGKNE